MKVGRIREHISTTVKKWAAEEKVATGRLRAKPEILLSFIPTSRRKPRVSADVSLYHRPKGQQPKTVHIQTTNSLGELVVTLETIVDEWKALSGYA